MGAFLRELPDETESFLDNEFEKLALGKYKALYLAEAEDEIDLLRIRQRTMLFIIAILAISTAGGITGIYCGAKRSDRLEDKYDHKALDHWEEQLKTSRLESNIRTLKHDLEQSRAALKRCLKDQPIIVKPRKIKSRK